MDLSNRYVLAAGTLGLALAIGFLMQGGRGGTPAPVAPPPAEVSGPAMTEPPASPAQAALVSPPGRLELTDIALTSAPPPPRLPAQPPRLAAPPVHEAAADLPEAVPAADTARPRPQIACAITMTASPRPGAMVALDLAAPCLPEERVTLHHSGLMFTAATDAEGHLAAEVPAMTEQAVFIAAFGNGEGAVAQTAVPEVAGYARVAVQARADGALHLHALEQGAEYGAAGHLWAEAPGAAPGPGTGKGTGTGNGTGKGGFLTRLGDAGASDALIAQIYSRPLDDGQQDAAAVQLSLEAEVTAANCGQEVAAQTISRGEDGRLRVSELTFYMPDCQAVGDFLVLKNLAADPTLAAR